jgi:cytoskeletal protein RodZ
MASEENLAPQSLSKKIRNFLLIATVIIIVITMALALKKPADVTQATLQQEIQSIQKQLPIRVDASTELINIDVGEMEIKYVFSVASDPTQTPEFNAADENFTQQVETAVKANACINKNTKRYINSNVSLSYRYMNKDNVVIADFNIPAGFCKK